jgi:hypothetical protein
VTSRGEQETDDECFDNGTPPEPRYPRHARVSRAPGLIAMLIVLAVPTIVVFIARMSS